jgi:hypothetical protein
MGYESLSAPVVAAVVAAAAGQHYQLLGILYRQPAQNELMDEREDGGIGADPEGQG